jgi:hypothetical protein
VPGFFFAVFFVKVSAMIRLQNKEDSPPPRRRAGSGCAKRLYKCGFAAPDAARRRHGVASSFLLNLALLAFLARSLIPVGFMPGQGHGAGNTYPLVICSGAGPVTIHVPADKLPQSPQSPHSHDNMPCPYAQAFSQGTTVDHPGLPQPLLASESVPAYPEASLSLKTVVKNYFSHGPPAFPA